MIESRVDNRPDHPLERLVFFSDAVMAIAITLLVVELHAEHLPWKTPAREYWIWLANETPSLVAFFISFFVIGAFWGGHHRAFALAGHYSEKLNFPNLLFLCAIAFMPFPTAWMGMNMGAMVPTLIYNLTLLATALLNVRLVRVVTAPPVVAETVDPETIAIARVRGWAVVIAASLAIVATLIFAPVAQFVLMTIPLWRVLLQKRALKRLAAERGSAAAG